METKNSTDSVISSENATSHLANSRLGDLGKIEKDFGWKSLRSKKPTGGPNLYDVVLRNGNVVRDCLYKKGCYPFYEISGLNICFDNVREWRLAESIRNDKSINK